jgi:hypothetical protein
MNGPGAEQVGILLPSGDYVITLPSSKIELSNAKRSSWPEDRGSAKEALERNISANKFTHLPLITTIE